MNQISAADSISIDIEPERWRLIFSTEYEKQVIAEANAGQPLRYASDFANTRRLPATGALPVDHVHQVVLGWSGKDEAWHLGLILGPELAEARDSRWCEMARWPDPDTTLFVNIAKQAGQSLAQTMKRPFHLVSPHPKEKSQQAPLPELPLKFGLWTFKREGEQLILKLSRRWSIYKLARVLWYSAWLVIYILLSITTLTKGLALPNAGTMLPNPELLPYLGLGAAVILVGLIVYHLGQWLTAPDTIVIKPQTLDVSASRSGRERWRVQAADVQSVYVTQVASKDEHKQIIQHGELNLHLGGGKFFFVLEQGGEEEPEGIWRDNAPSGEMVLPLTGEGAKTDLLAAGLHIAEALGGLPCWYDQRVK